MNEKLERVKAAMVRDHRFFATLLMSREWKEDSKLDAVACTDGTSITINPVEADMYTDKQVTGVIAHELAHIYGKHHLRRSNRDFETWSMACDYAINPQLIELGFELPPTDFLRYEFSNMCVEEIYNIIKKEKEEKENERQDSNADGNGGDTESGKDSKKNKNGKDKDKKDGQTGEDKESQRKAPVGGFDFVEDEKADDNSSLSEADKSMKEMEMNIIINQAARIAKQAGQFPAELEQLFDTLKKVETDWVEELRNLVQVCARNDYTWSHPNKRYIHQGLYLPSLHSMEMGKLGIIIDVSGSITSYQDMLSKFLSEIKTLLEEMRTTATIVCVNTVVQSVHEDLTSEDIDNVHIKGGGGTDFIPGFAWFEIEPPDVVIYFTDLQCSSYPLDPGYPVLWAVYGNKKDRTVPFGTVINLK